MKRFLLVVVILCCVAAGAWRLGLLKGPQSQTQPEGGRREMRDSVVPVSVAPAARQDMPVALDAIGTAQALNMVVVRSQVDGRLIEIAFTEGQEVKAGDIIARIDPATYQAQYDQVVAKKAQDEASLANARRDLERYVRLAADNSGSKQQADTQRASVAQLEAQVRADQAIIDNAKTILDYTTIRAPIDGRLGLRQVDQGNLVRASDSSGIVTIAQITPIAVILTLAQQYLGQINEALARGPVAVDALDSDNSTVLERGRVLVVDNQIDQATGAVKIKAIFPNERLRLWPGRFVNVKLSVDLLKDVVVVPSSAVQRGPSGAYVYVVKEDATVAQTPVSVGLQNERQAVIASGLAPPAQVAVTSFARLTNGAKVRVIAAPETGAPAKPAQPAQTEGASAKAGESGEANAPQNPAGRPGQGAGQGAGQAAGQGERRRGAKAGAPAP